MPTKSDIIEFLARDFPQNKCIVQDVGARCATVVQNVTSDHLRPGNTVSGPLLMTVADVAMYVAILATIGIIPLAVTTSFTINFLRKPSADRPILAECKLIKVGRLLIVGEVGLYSRGNADMVAHAVGTYSIPPVQSGSAE